MSYFYFCNKTNVPFEDDDCLPILPACQVLLSLLRRFVTAWKSVSIVSGESWALFTASGQLRAILPLAADQTLWLNSLDTSVKIKGGMALGIRSQNGGQPTQSISRVSLLALGLFFWVYTYTPSSCPLQVYRKS